METVSNDTLEFIRQMRETKPARVAREPKVARPVSDNVPTLRTWAKWGLMVAGRVFVAACVLFWYANHGAEQLAMVVPIALGVFMGVVMANKFNGGSK